MDDQCAPSLAPAPHSPVPPTSHHTPPAPTPFCSPQSQRAHEGWATAFRCPCVLLPSLSLSLFLERANVSVSAHHTVTQLGPRHTLLLIHAPRSPHTGPRFLGDGALPFALVEEDQTSSLLLRPPFQDNTHPNGCQQRASPAHSVLHLRGPSSRSGCGRRACSHLHGGRRRPNNHRAALFPPVSFLANKEPAIKDGLGELT